MPIKTVTTHCSQFPQAFIIPRKSQIKITWNIRCSSDINKIYQTSLYIYISRALETPLSESIGKSEFLIFRARNSVGPRNFKAGYCLHRKSGCVNDRLAVAGDSGGGPGIHKRCLLSVKPNSSEGKRSSPLPLPPSALLERRAWTFISVGP